MRGGQLGVAGAGNRIGQERAVGRRGGKVVVPAITSVGAVMRATVARWSMSRTAAQPAM